MMSGGKRSEGRRWTGMRAGPLVFCLALVLELSAPQASAISMPEIPQAPDMSIVVVSDHMVLNGLDMSTYQVASPHSLDEVLSFYRTAWRGEVAESPMQVGISAVPWTVLAHRDGDFLITVQLTPSKGGGVYGYIAISTMFADRFQETGRDVLMPAGSTLLNDITADDPGRSSRTLVIRNEDSVEFNLEYYRSHLRDQGWTEAVDLSAMPSDIAPHQVLMMNRGSDELNLSVTRSGGMTTVVMVTVHK
jgi:hypothetical protein